jgi:hypothetical protein
LAKHRPEQINSKTEPEAWWCRADHMSWPCDAYRLEQAVKRALGELTNADRPELDVERLADDVRYAGGNGTSDYWRGFNDGIDKLAARLRDSVPDESTPAPVSSLVLILTEAVQ